MTHDELLAQIEHYGTLEPFFVPALRAVVELHKPQNGFCYQCDGGDDCDATYAYYPCETIQAIEKELGGN